MTKHREIMIDPTSLPFFDRQERIYWWDQRKLFNARILVVGAGALGNEVLKNLALLGVGNILVIDFDTIEDSNLSRSVLFRSADAQEGASKARIAAARTKQLNPNPNAVVKALHQDVVWELGMGIFRRVDVVLGCLDNIEARIALNRNCWKTGTVWIDGGMWELSGSVTVFDSSMDKACYECGMTEDHYRAAKARYSCSNATVRKRIRQGFEPTTQTTSAIVAAIQTQETVKYLHGLPTFGGKKLVFNGAPHFYTDTERSPVSMVDLTCNPECLTHCDDRLSEVFALPEVRSVDTTFAQLFDSITQKTGKNTFVIELGRTFVLSAECPNCHVVRTVNKPLFRVFDQDVVCPTCIVECPTCLDTSVGQADCPNCGQTDINSGRLETMNYVSTFDAPNAWWFNQPLCALGIPSLHILTAKDEIGKQFFIELSGDEHGLWK